MRGRVGSEAPYRTLSPVVVVLHGNRLDVRDDHASPWRPHPFVAVAIVLGTLVFLLDLTPSLVVVLALATVLDLQATIPARRGRRLAEDLSRPPSVGQIACAVADSLLGAGSRRSDRRACGCWSTRTAAPDARSTVSIR
jgi:hypothetical protein